MWFVPLSSRYAGSWLGALLVKLLENDAATLALLRKNPFSDRPPRYVRVLLYRYRFTTSRERRESGAYWVRTPRGECLPPIALADAREGLPRVTRRAS